MNTLYPDLWGVVSRADHAMRFEQWSRMAYEVPPNSDWSVIIAASAFGEEGSRQVWWDRQVCKPALSPRPHALVSALEGYTPRGATLALEVPSPVAAPTGPTAGAAAALPPRKRRRGGGAGRGAGGGAAGAGGVGGADAPPAAGGAAKQNVCFAYNIGACSLPCPRSYAHRCSICGVVHPAAETPGCKDRIDATGRPKSQKGGGKGGKQ